MRDFDAYAPPTAITPEMLEVAMKRARRLRSEAMRELWVDIGRSAGAALSAILDPARRARRNPLAGRDRANGPESAPTRGHAAPGWRAALGSGGWVDATRCDGS